MRIKKGSYGHIESNKRISMMKSFSGLGIILVIFVLGLVITKTRLNWFTFASVLCALPVGKTIVEFIVAWPHKPMPKEHYNKIKEKEEGMIILYDLVITSYEKIMQIDSIAIKGNTLCAYSTDKGLNHDHASKYIKNILVNNGCSTSVKIFEDVDTYLARIDEINSNLNREDKSDTAKDRDKNKEDKVVETLLEISI
ncbi:hypothetical protein [Lachnotalea glycerini]|nr:hypothetical protein [Lachnotalea glycerini]